MRIQLRFLHFILHTYAATPPTSDPHSMPKSITVSRSKPRTRIRTTLSLDSMRLQRAHAKFGRLTDTIYINLLIYGAPTAPTAERWRDVVASPDGYKTLVVSDLGHALVRYDSACSRAEFQSSRYPKIAARRDDIRGVFDCHVLIADTFLPKQTGLRNAEICHRYPVPQCFHVNNLKRGSREENRAQISYPALRRAPSPPGRELWRYHPRNAGLFVSNHGLFRNRYFQLINTSGYFQKRGHKRVKKHVCICFEYEGNRPRYFLLHRLIWEAFKRPIPPRNIILHRSGDPHDNRLSNLTLGNELLNAADRARHGRTAYESQHPNASVPNDRALPVLRQYFKREISVNTAAMRLGVHHSTICAWLTGRNRPDLLHQLNKRTNIRRLTNPHRRHNRAQ